MIIPCIQIKWGKETIEMKDYDVTTGIKGLKHEIHVLTNVPMDRMKIMSKTKPHLWKGVLKDDDTEYINAMEDYMKKHHKSNTPIQLLLMGSASAEVLTGPKEKIVFLEDLPPEEIAKVVEPAGLVNLGNTCYLNSVIQCLRTITPFRHMLQKYTPSPTTTSQLNNQNPNLSVLFVSSLREAYRQLDNQATAYQPMALVHATKLAFPQFNQKTPQGYPMQQDAEEFYSGLLTILSTETQGTQRNVYMQAAFDQQLPTEDALMGATNVIDAMFGLKMRETLTCDELSSSTSTDNNNADMETDNNNNNVLIEPPVISYDLHRKLVCNIQGGSDGSNTSVNVNYINEGITLSLNGKIEKHSDILGRNAIWSRQQRIERLPPIITVQFGRFYWKATPDSQDHAGVKCKVMKPVAFSSELDVYDFCTPDIQKILQISRQKALQVEEERIQAKLKGTTDDDNTKMTTEEETKNENTDEEMDDELKAALALSLEPTEQEEEVVVPAVGPGLPSNFQGIYELFAVVTHKGRDADGGHYMAWVKADKYNDNNKTKKKIVDSDDINEDWFVYDDDEVSPCKTEDVLKLKGGGDWHMSYLNFYRAKK